MDNMRKMCEAMVKQDSEQMAKMMEQMPMMKEMCKAMFENNSDDKCCSSDCDCSSDSDCTCECGCDVNNQDNANIVTNELRPLFDEWVNQIKEEVNTYISENPSVSRKDIANYFKLSEQCIAYFLENNIDSKDSNTSKKEYEILRIKKTNNFCSLCEDYVKQNETKSIVIASCEGACLRGEISRKAANMLCHSLLPEKTVRLCLGSALTKESGQRSLVKNAKKIIVLEGCPVDCGSRMIDGLSFDNQLEVIRTDALAEFDKNLFGINELNEGETNNVALSVAKQIAEKL